MRWLVIAIMFWSVPAVSAPIKGAGAGSCGEWTEERRNNTYQPTLHWIQGFISAYNHYVYEGRSPDGVFGSADHKALAAWMDNYCSQNPLNSPYDGLPTLIDELRARAN